MSAVRATKGTALDLSDFTICPACRGELVWSLETIRCSRCSREFAIVDGIPILLIDKDHHGYDEMDSLHDHAKHRQTKYFDDVQFSDFEIERPRKAPRFYRWLLEQKFRISILGLEHIITGGNVLTVCGGSGMDADFLASSGARVICSDISLGAARRCRERALRYGLPITPVVADVEHLPFRDHSFDMAYVHDGLHHLSDPASGLFEMMRVAADSVSITEPAQAAITRIAVRLGLALDREPAGNKVIRLDGRQLADAMFSGGYADIRWGRYAMYYAHVPGRVFRVLSKPAVFPMARLLWRSGNLLLGPWGNKLSVRAKRREVVAS